MVGVADVVVCGAGVIGIASARYLAATGLFKRIVLVEKHEYGPLNETSARSSECFRGFWQDRIVDAFINRSVHLLSQHHNRLFAQDHHGLSLRSNGYAWLSTRQDLAKNGFEHASKLCHITHGIGLDIYEKDQIQEEFAYIDDRFESMSVLRRAGWLDAHRLGSSLLEEANQQHSHTQVQVIRGRVEQVHLGKNRQMTAVDIRMPNEGSTCISSPIFVAASGPWLMDVLSMVDKTAGRDITDRLQLRGNIHRKMVFHDRDGILPQTSPMLIASESINLNWTGQEKEAMQMNTAFERNADQQWTWRSRFPAGLHLRPCVGNRVLVAWDLPSSVIPSMLGETGLDTLDQETADSVFSEILLRGASSIVPSFKRYIGCLAKSDIDVDGGIYTGAADHRPVIGQMGSAISGIYICGGLSGFGIMGAHAAGEMLAHCVVQHQTATDTAASSPSFWNTHRDVLEACSPSRSAPLPYDINKMRLQEGPGASL